MEDCLSWKGHHPCWSRVRKWGVLLLRRKEWQFPWTDHFPHPPAPQVGKEKILSESKSRKQGGVGGSVSKIWLYSSSPYSDWVDNELNEPPQVKSILPARVTDEWSLSVLIMTHEPWVAFSLPYPAEKQNDRVALVGTWDPAKLSPSLICR